MHPPVIEHVSLHSKPLYKNMAVSGGVNNMHPLSWGGGGGGGGAQTEKIQGFRKLHGAKVLHVVVIKH